jgi:hypothetical protein
LGHAFNTWWIQRFRRRHTLADPRALQKVVVTVVVSAAAAAATICQQRAVPAVRRALGKLLQRKVVRFQHRREGGALAAVPAAGRTGPLHRELDERGAVGLEEADERVGRRAARQVAVDVQLAEGRREAAAALPTPSPTGPVRRASELHREGGQVRVVLKSGTHELELVGLEAVPSARQG